MLKTIIKNLLLVVLFCYLLIFFTKYPARLFVEHGIFTYNDIGYQIIATLSVFVMLFIVPIAVIKLFIKKPLSDFGFSIPENIKQSVLLTCLIIFIFLPFIYFFSLQPNFQNYYSVKTNIFYFLMYAISGVFYFFTEEFIFRGLLHFSLWNKFKFHTIWIINIIFALFHIGKPMNEIYFALFLGISLSFLSYKTKSFIPAAIVHFTLALFLNILVTFISPI